MTSDERIEVNCPYKAQPTGIVGWVIRGPDGRIFAWVLGELNARRVAGCLNLAHDCGLLD